MGFSVSAASAIIFIGMVISLGIMAVKVSEAFDSVRSGAETRVNLAMDRMRTQIGIRQVNYTNGSLRVDVGNTGSTELHASKISIVLNGVLVQSGISTSVEGKPTNLWLPGELLTITLTPSPSPTSVKVVTENGVAAYW